MEAAVRQDPSIKWRLLLFLPVVVLLGTAKGTADLAFLGRFDGPGEVLSFLAGLFVSLPFFLGVAKVAALFVPLFLLAWATETIFVLSREGLSVRPAWRRAARRIAWADVSRLRFVLSFAIPFRMVAGLEVTGSGSSILIPLRLRRFTEVAETIHALCPGAEMDEATGAVLDSLQAGTAGRSLEREMLRAVRRYVKEAGIACWPPIRWMKTFNGDPRHRDAFLAVFAHDRSAPKARSTEDRAFGV